MEQSEVLAAYMAKIRPHYNGYQELHIHTESSYRDGVNSVADIFDQAEKLGRKAVTCTDHGHMMRCFQLLKERTKREKPILERNLRYFGASEDEIKVIMKGYTQFTTVRQPPQTWIPYIEKYETAFVQTAQEAIQAIPGVEIYFSPTKDSVDTKKSYHLILYPKDIIGLKTLFKICSLAQLNKSDTDGKNPRTTWDDLEKLVGVGTEGHNHIIATSACVAGLLPATILQSFHIDAKLQKIVSDMQAEGITFSEENWTKQKERLETAKANLSNAKKDMKEFEKASMGYASYIAIVQDFIFKKLYDSIKEICRKGINS